MKARVKVAALATAGLLALTGCSNNPQVAAYVGDVQIPQGNVDVVARGIADATSDAYDTAVTFTGPVLQLSIQGTLAAEVGKSTGITVTDAQREAFYATNQLYPALAKNPATADFMRTYAETATILSDKAAQTAFAELLTKTTIRVNPRFGTWDPTTGGLVDGSTGSLSELAPTKG